MSEMITLETGEVLDVSAYPLPEGIEDDGTPMNMNEIAKAMAVSTVTIGRWIDAGMPVHQSGGNGKAYAFILSHCFAWRVWREEGEAANRRKKDDLAEQMAMHFLGGEDQVPDAGRGVLSPREMREYSEAELKRMQAAEQRGDLVRAHMVETVLEDILVAYRGALTNLPDWLEQEFSLSPGQVDRAQTFCDEVLADTRRRIEQAGFNTSDVVELPEPMGAQEG